MAAQLRPKPDSSLDWAIPLAAVELIADAEGLRLQAYRCVAGVWTIGWGETSDVRPGQTCTKEAADDMLCRSIAARAQQVLELCTDVPSDNELGAMTSLHYNIGHAGFKKSSVLRAHNKNDPKAASRAFGLWNQATVNGVRQELAGLTARRAAEAALYLTPDDVVETQPIMPQEVAPETSVARSPVAQSGAVAVAVGGLSVLAEVNKHLGSVGVVATSARTVIVDTLGIPASALVPVLLVTVGCVVVWQRWKQRIKGWA